MSHQDLILLRRTKMRSYYESVLIDSAPTSMGNHPYSLLVWIMLYFINILIILTGFHKHAWLFILSGLYGIYEITWEFSKLYPNWFERKFILTSYLVCLMSGFLMNFTPDYLRYKVYPPTKNSQYFYIFIHFSFKVVALVLLMFIANLDQHTPAITVTKLNAKESEDIKESIR